MRVAVNTRLLLPNNLEGIGWYIHELMRRMVVAHPEVQFLFIFDRPFDEAFRYGPNVEMVAVPPQARHPVLWYLWFEHSVPRLLRRWGADIFFSPDNYASLNVGIPTVLTVHDLIPIHFPKQIPGRWAASYCTRWFPRFMDRADTIITVSEYVKADIQQTAGISANKIKVIYNGCREGFGPISEPSKAAVQAEFSNGQPYFFYAGAIHPRKNVPRLLRAFDQFKSRTGGSVKLLLAGRWAWQTGEVKATWASMKWKEDVHFLGYVPEKTLKDLTAAAIAVTYVSWSEGFGLPLVEAMYSDVPVMAASATALPEVGGAAALWVDPFSEEEIARGLERLYIDENLRSTLIENGREQRVRFSWDRAARELWLVLEKTAKNPKYG